MKVLVVDDSKSIRTLVAECAKELGHDVFCAEDGEQAILSVGDNDVDLILLDVEMPGKNGFEITSEIRAMVGIDWFPIIFISSKVDDKSFAIGIEAGGDAYVQKPINLLRLQYSIKAMERIYVMRQELQIAQKELQAVNEELEQFALFDKLTSLANRRNFDESLQRQFLLAKKNKNPLTFVFCDVDFFKLYNDYYGHQQGDECLAEVAKIIGSIPQYPTDKACRYGGEEFAVILPDTSLLGGRVVGEKVRQAIVDGAIKHDRSEITSCITLSIGLSTYTGQFNTAAELVKAADEALYRAKKHGRNRVES